MASQTIYNFSNAAGTVVPDPTLLKQFNLRETRNNMTPTANTFSTEGLMTTKKPKRRNFLEAKGLGMRTLSTFSTKGLSFND